MRAVVIHAPKDLRIDDYPDVAPGPGEVRVKIANGGICGSDLHYYHHGGFGVVRIQQPIRVTHRITEEGLAVFPRLLAIAEQGSSVGVVEEYTSPDFAAPAFACAGVEIFAGNGAQVQYVGLQRWGRGVRHVATQRTIAGRDANLDTGGAIHTRCGSGQLGRCAPIRHRASAAGSTQILGRAVCAVLRKQALSTSNLRFQISDFGISQDFKSQISDLRLAAAVRAGGLPSMINHNLTFLDHHDGISNRRNVLQRISAHDHDVRCPFAALIVECTP